MLTVLCVVKLTVLKTICEEISVWTLLLSNLLDISDQTSIMKKKISTRERIFMTVVSPSGCGETNLIFRILPGNTFYPKFKNLIVLYHEMQPIYSQADQHSNIVFRKLTNLEFLQNTEICVLIFNNSREENFNGKDFVKPAATGRHKNVNVNKTPSLPQQNKCLLTKHLNTAHISLLKITLDVQQVKFLGTQLDLPHSF